MCYYIVIMRKENLKIPTINDAASDFDRLINLDKKIREICNHVPRGSKICLDFSECSFLRQNAVAYLGAISTYLKIDCGYKVFYKMGTMNERIIKMLTDDGFIQKNFTTHKNSNKPISSDVVKFNHFKGDLNSDVELSREIRSYIDDDWLKNDWIRISETLKQDISAKMYEIFANALEHSKSTVGCFACGQKYEETSEFVLSVIDLGVGIPGSVKKFLNEPINDTEAIAWAFKNNNTTRSNKVGGLGLDLIAEFLSLNHGELSIYSNNVCYRIKDKKVIIVPIETFFPGTIVNIRLRIDKNSFYLYTNSN